MQPSLGNRSRLNWAVVFALALAAPAACSSATSGGDSVSPSSGGSGGGGRSGGSGGTTSSGGSGPATGGSGAGGSGGGSQAGGTGGAAPSGSGGASGGGGGAASGGGAGMASGGSAGSDAAAGDDTPATPTGGDPCAGTKFCEDWDKQTPGQEPKGPFTIERGAAKAEANPAYATVTIDGAKGYSGKQSLHIHLANSPDSARAHLNFNGAPLFPVANEDLFGRAMIFLMKNPPRHWDLTTIFAAANANDEDDTVEQFSLSSSSPDGHIMTVHQPGDKSVDSSDMWPVGKWTCVQWEFKAGAKPTIVVKFDNKVIDKGMNAVLPNWKPPAWKSMFFGWKNFEGAISGDTDLWADDVAFGEKEIPCPPPPK